MEPKYSQLTAMLAITKASLKATFRSPSAVIFSIGFPLIFILVFGFMGEGSGFSVDVALDKTSDTANPVYGIIKQINGIHFIDKPDTLLKEDLEKGNLTAIINIKKNAAESPAYTIELKSSEAVKEQDLQLLQSILNSVIGNINNSKYPNTPTIAKIDTNVQKIPGRIYRRIDFILPGQLGFSLLSAGVFGVAFLFFNLRQQLVLKRFFATPITRPYIVLGEAISRVLFQMIASVVIISIGVFAFNFTLVNGVTTFLEIMLLSLLGLLVFMGYGFIVSNVAKNESTIPPFANLFTFPQFLLSGTFFPITVFPKWLQFFCNLLPLTHFNNAMREISFEGASLLSVWQDIGVLLIWGVILYAIAIKVFKWE
ncbi:MAG TPA: ABC transporter permease [Panacibacter sp.]|nr:ABC transporter permease [Panacibacter sp.]